MTAMFNEQTAAATLDNGGDEDYEEAMRYYENGAFGDENDYQATKMDLGNLAPYMKSKQNAYNIMAIEGISSNRIY